MPTNTFTLQTPYQCSDAGSAEKEGSPARWALSRTTVGGRDASSVMETTICSHHRLRQALFCIASVLDQVTVSDMRYHIGLCLRLAAFGQPAMVALKQRPRHSRHLWHIDPANSRNAVQTHSQCTQAHWTSVHGRILLAAGTQGRLRGGFFGTLIQHRSRALGERGRC